MEGGVTVLFRSGRDLEIPKNFPETEDKVVVLTRAAVNVM